MNGDSDGNMVREVDFDNYKKILEKIKRCRTELRPEELAGIYRKAFRKLLLEGQRETDQVVCAFISRRLPEGFHEKKLLSAALQERAEAFRNIYRMVNEGEELVAVICAIYDVAEVVAEDVCNAAGNLQVVN